MQEFYIGLTQLILQIRLREHSESDKSSIYDQQYKTKHNINFTSPEILDKDRVKFKFTNQGNAPHKRTISLQFTEPKHRFLSFKYLSLLFSITLLFSSLMMVTVPHRNVCFICAHI